MCNSTIKEIEHTKNKITQSFTFNSSLKHVKSILTPCAWSLWTLASLSKMVCVYLLRNSATVDNDQRGTE